MESGDPSGLSVGLRGVFKSCAQIVFGLPVQCFSDGQVVAVPVSLAKIADFIEVDQAALLAKGPLISPSSPIPNSTSRGTRMMVG